MKEAALSSAIGAPGVFIFWRSDTAIREILVRNEKFTKARRFPRCEIAASEPFAPKGASCSGFTGELWEPETTIFQRLPWSVGSEEKIIACPSVVHAGYSASRFSISMRLGSPTGLERPETVNK